MTMTRPTTEQITHKGQLLSTVLEQAVNVKDFGAVGDGVTDDLSAIRNAVAAVKARGGGTVFIPRTANGYYVSANIGCDLSNCNGISIVSDRAEIKMQGAANLAGGASVPLLYGSNIANFTMQGLIFSATSTVLRYNKGDTDFDSAVNDGSASALAQTSFRYVINCNGGINPNVVIDNCDFLTGIYFPINVKNPSSVGGNTNLRFTNLRFIGVNSQCVYVSGVRGLAMDNVIVDGGQDSRFDHLLYAQTDCKDIVISNIVCKNNNGTALLGRFLVENYTVNNVLFENLNQQQLSAFEAINFVASNIVFKNVTSDEGVLTARQGRNALFSNITFDNCSGGTTVDIGDSTNAGLLENVALRDFVAINSGRIRVRSGTNLVIENGVVVDPTVARVLDNGGTGGGAAPLVASDVTFRNVDIVYKSYVPDDVISSWTGALWNVTIDNCGFYSLAGISTRSQIWAVSSVVSATRCRVVGFSGTLSVSSGLAVSEVVHTQPLETTLTANSATPSVVNARLFVTANTSATAYTNFTGGVNGQEICVRVDDANTTFDFTGTSLKGRNGVDYTATSGDVIFAKRIGSNWYCTVVEA